MHRTGRFCIIAFLAAVALPACGGAGGSATDSADAALVTTLSDDGRGSLRQAIEDLGTNGTVVFDAALEGTLDLRDPIEIHGKFVIEGAGRDRTILRRNVGLAIFEIHPGADVVIRDLTLRGPGGAVQVSRGRVRLERVRIEDVTINSPIENRGGLLDMRDCVVRNCEPATQGGGLRIDGGVTTIRRCTFHDNTSLGDGGAIYQAGGVLLLVNCTLHRNTALPIGAVPSVGGAIRSADSSINAEATLLHCTVTQNQADDGGGLVFRYAFGGIATVRGCIVAENAGAPADIAVYAAAALDGAFNVVGIDGAGGIVDGVNGNAVGTSAAPLATVLGAMLDLGGETPTRQPVAGSPALGRVPPEECLDIGGVLLETDQRGFLRPQSGNCEAGSFER